MDLVRPFRGPLSGHATERILRAFPALAYLVMIHVVSSIPGSSLSSPVDDRIAHSLEYFGLSVLLMFALSALPDGVTPARASFAVAFSAVYGAIDEWHQSFVPLRDSSVKDWIFDVIGAAFAAVVVLALVRRRGTR